MACERCGKGFTCTRDQPGGYWCMPEIYRLPAPFDALRDCCTLFVMREFVIREVAKFRRPRVHKKMPADGWLRPLAFAPLTLVGISLLSIIEKSGY